MLWVDYIGRNPSSTIIDFCCFVVNPFVPSVFWLISKTILYLHIMLICWSSIPHWIIFLFGHAHTTLSYEYHQPFWVRAHASPPSYLIWQSSSYLHPIGLLSLAVGSSWSMVMHSIHWHLHDHLFGRSSFLIGISSDYTYPTTYFWLALFSSWYVT